MCKDFECHSASWIKIKPNPPDGPPSMNFSEIEAEELPPSQWDAAVQEKHQQVLAERNHFLHNLGSNPEKTKIRMMFKL
jgi:hypothetical protein